MRYIKKFESERLYLSPVNEEDYETYAAFINDITTSVPLGNATMTFSFSREKTLLSEMVKDGHNFAVIKKDNDQLIGNCSLFNVSHLNRTAELGLFIGLENERGKGYGVEIIHILLSYGFLMLNLNNIMLKVFSFNKRGIKAYEKVGFKVFGTRHQAYYMNDHYFDEIYMELLKEDYECRYLKDILPVVE